VKRRLRVTTLTRIKLGLAIMALIFFAAGIRSGLDWQRWVAIGLLAVAVVLRYVERLQQKR
jgi:hypothetical protein